MGAIDHHFQSVEPDVVRYRLLDRVDVAPARILDPARAADMGGIGQLLFAHDRRLDRAFIRIGQLEAVRPEQLDAVILIRIVAGGDHHAHIGAHFPGDEGDGRGRQRPGHDHVHAHAGETGDQRAFHHISRQSRILADDDPVAVIATHEVPPRRLPHAHGDLGGHHIGVGASANTVGAEKPACHN